MTEKVYRQEVKSLLPNTKAYLLEQRVASVLQPDEHAGADGVYYIRSIYFDTENDKAYEEKLMGISEREKFRIRIYGKDSHTVHLERKEKKENLIYKEVMAISRDTAQELVSGNFEGLLSYEHPLASEVYSKAKAELLKPVVIVDYRRKAYTYPVGNVRITFDSCLQSRAVAGSIWEPGALYDVLGQETILEVKYNQYLPEHIRQLVCSVPGQRLALSKYVLCRDNLQIKQGDFLGGKR
ncbi:MAG: polyphosphate polymerase domain-containing protein [Lachnospiraceae bacterium]|nr:polyphosphate polymerase domain-containing protein [Lachnospiraceae bacterium]